MTGSASAGSAPAAEASPVAPGGAAPGASAVAQSLYRAVAQALPLPESAMSGSRGLPVAAPLAAKADAPPLSDPAPALRRPPPPYRGAAPVAQPPTEAAIPAAPREAARLLLAETDAALARHTLLQAASLPDRAEPMHGDPARPCWTFEIPFATPRGTAIAQFEIARDGHARPADAIKPVWRARFSLDVEPMGAVHAQVALVGERASVTLWADREDSAAQLRASAALLTDALRAADLDPGDVLVRGGPRPRETAPAGRFLDRAT